MKVRIKLLNKDVTSLRKFKLNKIYNVEHQSKSDIAPFREIFLLNDENNKPLSFYREELIFM